MSEIILLRPTKQCANFEARLKAMYKSGYVPSEVFLAVRQKGMRLKCLD